LQTVNQK